jgi:hypothetical protein
MARKPLAEIEPMRKHMFHSGTLDAAQHPPSVFVQHHGEPQIMHDDLNYDRARRNGVTTDQERLSGV